MTTDPVSPQVTGSINFDTRHLGEALIAALHPVLERIELNLSRLAGHLAATAMDEEESVTVLAQHLPAMTSSPWQPDNVSIAGHLAEHLAQAGYALVAVTGPALKLELDRHDIRTGFDDLIREVTHPSILNPDQRAREDEWFSPGRDD